MKLKDLIAITAEITGMPEITVSETARSLQKANWIKTGKPGRYGGSKMDENDAAALAVAIISAGEKREVTTAHQSVEYMSVLRPHNAYVNDTKVVEHAISGPFKKFRFDGDAPETFFDLVAALIRDPRPAIPYSKDPLTYFDISTSFPAGTGHLYFAQGDRTEEVIFRHPSYFTKKPAKPVGITPEWRTDAYRVTRVLRDRFFWSIHEALSEDRD